MNDFKANAHPSGFLLIDKPVGITSFDVVSKIRSMLPRGAAVGHAGTLDPFATGLLIIAIGRATKLTQYFLGGKKRYEAALFFGEKTESGDHTNPVIARTETIPKNIESIRNLSETFLNSDYYQTPPMTSAKKVEGKKLYELARQQKVIERKSILKKIFELKINEYKAPLLKFECLVESGTYVRVLGEDLAEKCGSLGHLKELRRLASSRFEIKNAISFSILTKENLKEILENKDSNQSFIPFDEIFFPLNENQNILREDYLNLLHGKKDQLQIFCKQRGFTLEPSFIPLFFKESLNETFKLVSIIRFHSEKNEWRSDFVEPTKKVL